jgi:hypothetical protein
VFEPPGTLVRGGRVRFGTFSGPIPDVNLIDAQPWTLPVPRAIRNLRLKEWQAFQFGNRRHFVTVALFNAKLLALAQIKVYDREERKKVVFERQLPGWALEPPRTLLDSRYEWSDRGASVRIRNQLLMDRVELELDLPPTALGPAISGRITAHAEGCEPQVVSIPFGRNHGMYSHKACLAVTGTLEVGEATLPFQKEDSFCFLDDHKGYYPYVMRWDWVVGGGIDGAGRRIGFNLTRNESIDPERYNENCVWLDGKRHLLPPVNFSRHPSRSPEVWEVRDRKGDVEVDFEVELPGPVSVNAIVVESRYQGPFGRFRGAIRTAQGERVSVDGLFGMGEDFYLRC